MGVQWVVRYQSFVQGRVLRGLVDEHGQLVEV